MWDQVSPKVLKWVLASMGEQAGILAGHLEGHYHKLGICTSLSPQLNGPKARTNRVLPLP